MGLLKLAVLETASTWPGLLGSTSMALASDSALDSSEWARFFRLSFFRASTLATGEFRTLSAFRGVVVEGVGVCGWVVCVPTPLLEISIIDELLAPSYEGVGVCMPRGVAIVFGVFDVVALMCEPFEFVLRSNADIELSFLPSEDNDDKDSDDEVDCIEGGTNELGVGGAYEGVNG
ncbi:hypothetical protein FF38_13240 [Lucilia cuprina]|uniref:Uncharacterized protein n=1 Tax=Lucilia cuprina TaxID=7375 RepID=A0A0L0BU91_LUCCU|nr:hypothetical protein FF38_13240 [Lucilia cuprina]